MPQTTRRRGDKGGPATLLASLLDHAAVAAATLTGAEAAVAALAAGRRGLVLGRAGRQAILPASAVRQALHALHGGSRTTRVGARTLAMVRLGLAGADGCLVVAMPAGGQVSPRVMARLDGLANALVGAEVVTLGEYRRIARDLHDTFGQTLTALVFAIDELERALPSAEQRLLTRGVRAYGLRAVRQLRDVVGALVEGGREETPRRLAALLEELPHGVPAVRFTNDVGLRTVPADVEACLHHVAREALLNVRRHARARQVDVRLGFRHHEIELVVVDDGQGFETTQPVGPGWGRFGLRMMQERVEELGGHFTIESTLGEGTRIAVHIPCSASRTARRQLAGARRSRG